MLCNLVAAVTFVAVCGILGALMQEYPTLNRIVLIILTLIIAWAFIGGLF